jgi:hypothetical protein
MDELIYEDVPRYDIWLKLILGVVLALTFVAGVVLLFEDIVGAWVMFGVTIFDALLFKAILPKRFQVFKDRLKIILGGPFNINIPFSNIQEARPGSPSQSFFYWGIRLATSTQGIVEIVRRRGLSLVISPSNADLFLEQLGQALSVASKSIESPS